MSISSAFATKQHKNTAISLDYGPVASGKRINPISLPDEVFSHALSFLDHKNLALIESVCRSWNQFIDKTEQWKKRCRVLLNSGTFDPGTDLPACKSYKEGLRIVLSRVYDAAKYRYYLGAEIDPVPRAPETLSLKRFNEPDPCDPTQRIGHKYVWIDSPSYFNIPVDGDFPFELDKPDNPNDEEAPRLIQKKVGLVEQFKRKTELGSEPKKEVLKVPNTINNLPVLFERPKNGHPSEYEHIGPPISSQHGNKRIPAGRICMRENVIGMHLTFAQQQEAARQARLVIPQLGHRILFDLLRHAETDIYPDGQNPWTYARTSTLTVDSQGTPWPSDCGGGGPSGLNVRNGSIARVNVGAAVALPAEVQAIDP